MSSAAVNAIQWLVVLLFFVCFWGFIIGEAFWLSRKGWAATGRSFAFSVTSNITGFIIGSIVVFVILAIMLMITFEPVKDRQTTESLMWIGVVLALLFPPVFLLLVKRLLLKLFKMDTDRKVWLFCLVSSVLIVFASVLIPSAAIYVVSKIS